MSCWFVVTHIMYGIAFVLIVIAALSLPFARAVNAFVAQIQFNENYFNGSLNGTPVENVMTLNLGNWAACYSNLQYSNVCLESAFAYTVTATGITKDNSAITIVKPGWTGGLSAAALPLVPTILLLFYKCNSDCFWFELIAIVFSIISGGFDIVLYKLVQNEMQTIGEPITTNLGSVPILSFVGAAFVCVGAFFRRYFAKKDKEAADKKEKDEKARKEKPLGEATFVQVNPQKIASVLTAMQSAANPQPNAQAANSRGTRNTGNIPSRGEA